MTIVVSLIVAFARYGAMPEAVPAFVSLSGEPTAWMPKSLLAVGRVPLMGAGQLLAVTALDRFRTASPSTTAWPRFFRGLAIAVAAKTLLESVAISGTGTAWGHAMTLPLQAATISVVLAFIVYAARLWRAGLLEAMPTVAPRVMYVQLAIGVALWLALALAPYAG